MEAIFRFNRFNTCCVIVPLSTQYFFNSRISYHVTCNFFWDLSKSARGIHVNDVRYKIHHPHQSNVRTKLLEGQHTLPNHYWPDRQVPRRTRFSSHSWQATRTKYPSSQQPITLEQSSSSSGCKWNTYIVNIYTVVYSLRRPTVQWTPEPCHRSTHDSTTLRFAPSVFNVTDDHRSRSSDQRSEELF